MKKTDLEKAISMADNTKYSIEDIMKAFPETPFKWFLDNKVFFTSGGVVEFTKEEHKINITVVQVRGLDKKFFKKFKRNVYRGKRGTVSTRYYARGEARTLAFLL